MAERTRGRKALVMENGYITVVSGLPRSGTSMMMRMLQNGGIPVITDRIRQADDDNPLGYYEFEPVKRLDKDASWLPDAYGKAIKVTYILLYNLPSDHRYKVIFMKRDLDEVIASQKVMLRRQKGNSLDDHKLMQSFKQQLQMLYKWISRRENFTPLYIDYGEILNSPERLVSEITRFLGVPLDAEAMIKTIDPALHRNRSVSTSLKHTGKESD
jgi:hypothetical protein